MGLIRLLIAILIIWLLYFLIKNWLQRRNAQNKVTKSAAMAQCELCSTYLPKDKAIQHHDLWFCSQEHKTAYLKENDK